MEKYGIPYQGNKSTIAKGILNVLPAGNRLVDLFGGGGAITHCAMQNYPHKWSSILYNDINPLVTQLFKDAVSGKYSYKNFTPVWVSREDFQKLKDKEGYIKYIWSFGNNGQNYLYAKEVEPLKKALHIACVFGDYSEYEKFGFKVEPVEGDTANERKLLIGKQLTARKEEFKACYKKWYCEQIDTQKRNYEEILKIVIDNVDKSLKDEKERLRAYLCSALKQSGLTQADVNRHLNTQMSAHYFGASQWEFPLFKEYKKLQEILPLKDDYFVLTNYLTILPSLQSLQRLPSLQSLQRLQSLTVSNIDYRDYKYQQGDIVYCDIPYDTPHKRGNYGLDFDHTEFYNWVRTREFPVYFSSYPINEGFKVVFEREKINLICATNKIKSLETVYWNGVGNHNVFDLKVEQQKLFNYGGI